MSQKIGDGMVDISKEVETKYFGRFPNAHRKALRNLRRAGKIDASYLVDAGIWVGMRK